MVKHVILWTLKEEFFRGRKAADQGRDQGRLEGLAGHPGLA